MNDLLQILTFVGAFVVGYAIGYLYGSTTERNAEKPVAEPKKPLPECLRWVNEE